MRKCFYLKYRIFSIVENWVIDLIDQNILCAKQKESQKMFFMLNKKHSQNQMRQNKAKVNPKL